MLAALEKDTGHRCIDHFDLIAGTSTGAIIALGLGQGLSAAEIVEFYTKHGPTIFPSTSMARRWSGVVRHLFQRKHSRRALQAALTQVLGERKFGESLRPLVMQSAGGYFLLKTAHHEHLRHDYDAPAVEVALATPAAPTYFAAARFPNHGNNSYVDGGVWANSSALAALVDAVHFLGQRLEDVDILSIGTTTTPFNVAERHRSGILDWNKGPRAQFSRDGAPNSRLETQSFDNFVPTVGVFIVERLEQRKQRGADDASAAPS